LLGDLRRVSEQTTKLLGDLSWFMKELEQGSALPALAAALQALRGVIEEILRLLGDARQLVDGLQEGDLLKRVSTIVETQGKDEYQRDKEEVQVLELSRLVKRLQSEVANRRSLNVDELSRLVKRLELEVANRRSSSSLASGATFRSANSPAILT
jgi:hypothetical protein